MAYNFEDRFVHFRWDDKLKGKKCFLADSIPELEEAVNKCDAEIVFAYADTEHPFRTKLGIGQGIGCVYKFCYYDPNYNCKIAYAEGKQIEYLSTEGEWLDCRDKPSWSDYAKYRIKPDEPKSRRMTYRELAEWLAKGNGEYRYDGSCFIKTCLEYTGDKCTLDRSYEIRRWGSDEWIKPTVDEFNKDCRREGLSEGK